MSLRWPACRLALGVFRDSCAHGLLRLSVSEPHLFKALRPANKTSKIHFAPPALWSLNRACFIPASRLLAPCLVEDKAVNCRPALYPMKSPFVPIWTMMLCEPDTHGQESAALSSEPAAVRLPPAEPPRPKRSALVVDDDTEIPPLVGLALSRYDFQTEGVSDGAAALVRLHSRVYDLVIL